MNETSAQLLIESHPQRLIGAIYEALPFPQLGPRQEVVFDLGITSLINRLTLSGLVIKGYHEHQLLIEQRWPARILSQHTGEADLSIDAGTGLAVRNLHLQLFAYEPLSFVEITAVGKLENGETAQEQLRIPVEFPEAKTDLHFPLRGAWWAIQGNDWSDRHKEEVFSQPYALDFVKLGADNQFFRGNGSQLEDHYSWDQPVYATAGGKVAYVSYDMPDLQPGVAADPALFQGDHRRFLGNAVAISHGNGEFSYYGHLQQLGTKVNEGELIKRGTLIGKIGNSGASPGPHLHFQLMEGPNLFIDQGLPVKFSHFWAGGQFYEKPIHIPTRMIMIGKED